MGWKGWLKGGVIGAIVSLISISLLFFERVFGACFSDGSLVFPLYCDVLGVLNIIPMNLFATLANGTFISVPLHILSYFIIVALIGWIVGRFKSKK